MNWPRGLDLYWMTKVAWSEVLIIAALVKMREKKGDHVADAIVVVSTAVAVGAIWAPEIRATIVAGALATPLAPIAAVVISAYAVGGIISYLAAEEGKEAEALVEYYHDPIGTTGDIIVEKVTDPVITYLEEEIWQKQLVDPITGWVGRRERELAQAKKDLESGLKKYWALTSPF